MGLKDRPSGFHISGDEMQDNLVRLDEPGLIKIIDRMLIADCGMITASRGEQSKRENLQRNVSLLAKLQDLRYNVISVRGGYIENYGSDEASPVHENTFFVVNARGVRDLEADLRKLGEEFDQDSIMFIPKGGQKSILIGTSHRDKAYPPYGQKEEFSNLKVGYKRATKTDDKTGEQVPLEGYNRPDPEFFTLKGKLPFFYESIVREHVLPEGWGGRLGCSTVAKKSWREIPESMFDRLKD